MRSPTWSARSRCDSLTSARRCRLKTSLPKLERNCMRFVLLALAGLILSLKLWSNVMLTQQVFGDRNDDPPPECLLVFPHNDLTRVLLQQPNGSVNLDAKEFKIAMR